MIKGIKSFKVISVSLLFTLIFSMSFSSYASFDKALELYQDGKFEQAKSSFEALSAIGVRSALFNLAVMYYRGEAVEQDVVKAYVLMRTANDGFDDASWGKVADAIFSKFTEQEKEEVEARFGQLSAEYSISAARERVTPKSLSDADCIPEPSPLKQIVPKFPRRENINGTMGIVTLEYTISPEGYVRDLTVENASTPGFAKASIEAAETYIYERSLAGNPTYGHRHRYTYTIDDADIYSRDIYIELDNLEKKAKADDPVAQYLYASRLDVYRNFKDQLTEVDFEYRVLNDWYLKSAEAGLAHAQFEIGRNMLTGRGCEVDLQNGMKWINAAAISGYSPAQRAMGRSIFATSEQLERDRAIAAVSWLRNASLAGDQVARVWLAWELASSPFEELRNGEEALNLLAEKSNNYYDEVRLLESKAAAHAEMGHLKEATKMQEKAIKLAKKRDWTIPLMQERLGLYQHNEPYRGSYY